MKDETIAPTRYRTGQGDRGIPFFLGLSGALTLPVLGWAAGPFLWPWGTVALVLVGCGTLAAFLRWWGARETVFWAGDLLEFRRGSQVLSLDPDALTRVDVRPSSVRTRLEAGPHRWRLSHRLVRVDDLLDKLRLRRPDLFPEPRDEIELHTSSVSAWIQAALAIGTAGAGWALSAWQPWLGVFFFVAAGYTLVRVLLFIPRGYWVKAGSLTVLYWVRKKAWPRSRGVREDAYAAGGAVFFRMRFDFGQRSVVLDEGQLVQPLRPWAGWIVGQMAPLNR